MPAESYTQGRIVLALKARGAYVRKQHQTGYTPSGTPDLLVGYRGLFIAFEVKNAKFKNPYTQLSEEQQTNAVEIKEAGCLFFAVNSVAQVIKVLDELDTILESNFHGA